MIHKTLFRWSGEIQCLRYGPSYQPSLFEQQHGFSPSLPCSGYAQFSNLLVPGATCCGVKLPRLETWYPPVRIIEINFRKYVSGRSRKYPKRIVSVHHCIIWVCKGKGFPLQTRSGPEESRKLRFPDFMSTAQDDGKVVSPTHRPHLPPGSTPGAHFC